MAYIPEKIRKIDHVLKNETPADDDVIVYDNVCAQWLPDNRLKTVASDVAIITEAIGNLADAQGQISEGAVGPIGTTEGQLDFVVDVDSTDTDVFTFDAVSNTMTFKKPGSYNFTSDITLESSTNSNVNITFNLRNTANEAIVASQDLAVELHNNDKGTYTVNTLVVISEGEAPLTLKIMASADITGMSMFAFHSILASMASVSGGFTDHSALTGTSGADSHPVSAITGLTNCLAGKSDTGHTHSYWTYSSACDTKWSTDTNTTYSCTAMKTCVDRTGLENCLSGKCGSHATAHDGCYLRCSGGTTTGSHYTCTSGSTQAVSGLDAPVNIWKYTSLRTAGITKWDIATVENCCSGALQFRPGGGAGGAFVATNGNIHSTGFIGNATTATTASNAAGALCTCLGTKCGSHTHSYISEGGTAFSGTYPMAVRVSANNFYSNANVTFNGTTNTLTAPIFAGALSGNATTATTASNAAGALSTCLCTKCGSHTHSYWTYSSACDTKWSTDTNTTYSCSTMKTCVDRAGLTNCLSGKLSCSGGTLTGNLLMSAPNPWLTLDSGSGGACEAGISIGESGKCGAAALHIMYCDNGIAKIGMGTVTDGSWMAYPALCFQYQTSSVCFPGNICGACLKGNATTATTASNSAGALSTCLCTKCGSHTHSYCAAHTHDYVPERSRSDWNDNTVICDVVGQLGWKNYGNNHTIFDASASTSPTGVSKNNTNPDVAWAGTYPTLMGYNGNNTYGVRVDIARKAEEAVGALGTCLGTKCGSHSHSYCGSHTHSCILGSDTSNLNTQANYEGRGQLLYNAYSSSASNDPNSLDNANGVLTMVQHSGGYTAQLAFSSDGNFYHRDNPSSSTGTWHKVYTAGNVPTWNQSTTGNATTATTASNSAGALSTCLGTKCGSHTHSYCAAHTHGKADVPVSCCISTNCIVTCTYTAANETWYPVTWRSGNSLYSSSGVCIKPGGTGGADAQLCASRTYTCITYATSCVCSPRICGCIHYASSCICSPTMYVGATNIGTCLGNLNTNKLDCSGGIVTGGICRTTSENGYFIGNYNTCANSTYTNPIYTIGTSYKPTASCMCNMYGIGYTNCTNCSSVTDYNVLSGWGMYVAADGDARIGLNASSGIGCAISCWKAPVICASSSFCGPAICASGCVRSTCVYGSSCTCGACVRGTSACFSSCLCAVTCAKSPILCASTAVCATCIKEVSARCLKENICEYGNVTCTLDDLGKLKPVKYNFKDNKSVTEYGLIADDVEEVYPEFVTYDGKGNVGGLTYSKMTSVLIQGINDLNEIVKKQAEEIQQLKGIKDDKDK